MNLGVTVFIQYNLQIVVDVEALSCTEGPNKPINLILKIGLS